MKGRTTRRGALRRGTVVLVLAVGLPVVLYTAYAGTVFARQRTFLFPHKPNPRRPDSLSRWLETPEARIETRWFPAAGDTTGTAALFFHGNKEVVDQWPKSVEAWNRHGVGVLLVEYPGYGNATGEPTQVSLRHAAEAGWDWLVAQPGIRADRVFAAGRSLGGGVACDLSTTRPVAGLFLQSTFASIRLRGSSKYRVPAFLVRDPFDNVAALRAYRGPVLAMQGTEDRTIPFADLSALREARPDGRFVVFPGHGHSTIPGKDSLLYWASVDSFLAQVRAGRR